MLFCYHTGELIIVNEAGEVVEKVGGIGSTLAVATPLMILFRRQYPRWWFDFRRELARFESRIGAYLALLTDQYPSTVEEQSVHLEIDYPDVEGDLNRWLPLVKWFLAIPHYFVLLFLGILAFFAVIGAWFAILFTDGRYPRGLFDFVVGVFRWGLRVAAYGLAAHLGQSFVKVCQRERTERVIDAGGWSGSIHAL